MTYETYMRILRDRLEELNVELTVVKKILQREAATVEAVSSDNSQMLFSEERLSIIIASATRHINKTSVSTSQVNSHFEPNDENKDNVAVQSSFSDKTIRIKPSIIQEDATVMSPLSNTVKKQSDAIPQTLLESDTTTVVISRKSETSIESATVISPLSNQSELEKLLVETGTVHISEKDTAEFLIPSQDSTAVLPTVMINREYATDIAAPLSKSDTDILPLIDEAYQKKKTINQFSVTAASSSTYLTPTVIESELKNNTPILWLLTSFVVLLPCLIFVCGILGITVLSVILCLALATFFSILLYVVILSGSFGCVLYGIYCSISFFSQNSITNGYKSIGIIIIFLAVFTLSILFLHRIILPIYCFFLKKLKRFTKRSINVYRTLFRHILKTARYL